MTLSEAAARVGRNAARVGLIATVSVIIVISTLLPLLKEPARSSDTRTLAAFAVPLALPERNAGLPALVKPAIEHRKSRRRLGITSERPMRPRGSCLHPTYSRQVPLLLP